MLWVDEVEGIVYTLGYMKRVLNKLQHSTLFYAFLGVFFMGIASTSLVNVFASAPKCYGQYGDEIECPIVNKSFSVEKTVRVGDQGDWSDEVSGIKAGQEVQFEVTVLNTGEAKISDLKVIDVLPSNLTRTSDLDNWVIDNFEPGDVRKFWVKATANYDGIAVNQEKCVVNVVNLVYKGTKEASDTASVCIKNEGKVLSAQTPLPMTGSVQMTVLGVSIVALLVGLIISTVFSVVKELRVKK